MVLLSLAAELTHVTVVWALFLLWTKGLKLPLHLELCHAGMFTASKGRDGGVLQGSCEFPVHQVQDDGYVKTTAPQAAYYSHAKAQDLMGLSLQGTQIAFLSAQVRLGSSHLIFLFHLGLLHPHRIWECQLLIKSLDTWLVLIKRKPNK